MCRRNKAVHTQEIVPPTRPRRAVPAARGCGCHLLAIWVSAAGVGRMLDAGVGGDGRRVLSSVLRRGARALALRAVDVSGFGDSGGRVSGSVRTPPRPRMPTVRPRRPASMVLAWLGGPGGVGRAPCEPWACTARACVAMAPRPGTARERSAARPECRTDHCGVRVSTAMRG